MNESKASITFLTRFYPPNPNINGKEVRDMAYHLEKNYNIKSNIITIDRELNVGGVSKSESFGNVIRLKTKFHGPGKISRIIAMFYDGYILVKESLKHKDTHIIVTTSPPLLPFWASKYYKKNVKWSLWSLDLFPEGLAASNYISEKNPIFKYLKRKTYKNPPNHLIALGPKQAEHIQQEYNQPIQTSIHPCGVHINNKINDDVDEWYEKNKIHIGYCGNLNDAHNPNFIKAIIDHIDPNKHKLILSLYGNKADEIKEYAKNKKGVEMLSYVSRIDLLDIHLVSLNTSWTHIAVPSKAMSAISMGCSMLFCGSKESDIWYLFQEAGWLIDESKDIDLAVQQFLNHITIEEINKKKLNTSSIYQNLKNNVNNTHKNISEIAL